MMKREKGGVESWVQSLVREADDADLRRAADRCVEFILEGLTPEQARIISDNLGRLARAVEALGSEATPEEITAYARALQHPVTEPDARATP